MAQQRHLFIECGPASLSPFRVTEQSGLVDQLMEARRIATHHNIQLRPLIYAGIESPLSGGRRSRMSLSEMSALVATLNGNGYPFNLALNGGLNLDPDLDGAVLHSLDPALDILVRNSRTHGVRNGVTITHPALFNYVRSDFSELSITASCIQALYPFCRHDYGFSFRRYDYVVPLNQHATPEFLLRYRAFREKMVLFLTLGCGTPNLTKCYLHYCDIESSYSEGSASPPSRATHSQHPLPSQLSDPRSNCDNSCLLERGDEMTAILRMGVNKFKVPRNGTMSRERYLRLLQLMNQH